jgi:outer membrane biosynthesis protein TonB
MLQLPWKNLAQLRERMRSFFGWWFFSAVAHILGLLLLFSLHTGLTVHTVHMRTEAFQDRPIVVVPFVSAAMQKKNAASRNVQRGTVAAGKTVAKKQEKSSKTTIKEAKPGVAKPQKKGITKESKKPEPKVEKKVEEKKTPEPAQKVVEQKQVDQKGAVPTEQVEPLYVSQSELEQYEIETMVHHAVAQQWCKPVGLGAGVSCKVRVTIDQAGNVIEVHDEQPSGVLMFDEAVYMALEHTQFPQRLAGKTVSIIFS